MEAVEIAGTSLGQAAAGMINFLNPSHLFLGGGTLQYPRYQEAVLKAIHQHTLPDLLACCEISAPPSGENSVASGALIAGLKAIELLGDSAVTALDKTL